jgi:hypothetical protein
VDNELEREQKLTDLSFHYQDAGCAGNGGVDG